MLDLGDLDRGTGASEIATSGATTSGTTASTSASTSNTAASSAEASSTTSAMIREEYRDAVLADAPSVYFRFEERGPELFDEVSQSVMGMAVDEVAFGATGAFEPRSGASVELQGGHLVLDDAAPVAWQGVEPYTVEMWFNPREDILPPGQYPRLFTRETFGPRDGIVIALTLAEASATTCRIVWERFAADEQDQVAASDVPTIGFTYLVGTFDGATMKLFVNATEVASGAAATSLSVMAPVHLGAVPGAASTEMKGHLDEVALYPVALDPARILAHYEARLP